MACGCRGGTPATAQMSTATPAQMNPAIEYVVRLPDGTYSDPQESIEAAFELATRTGGQARSRAKV